MWWVMKEVMPVSVPENGGPDDLGASLHNNRRRRSMCGDLTPRPATGQPWITHHSGIGHLSHFDGLRPYPANLCSLFGWVEFAGFGEDLGESIGELIETVAGRAGRQRPAEHLDSVLREE